LHEVPANADVEHDPSKEARAARKAHMAKNEQQRLNNLARSQRGQATTTKAPGALSKRKGDIERTLAMTRASTASLGKFDRMLEGEKNRAVANASLNRRKGRSKRKKARIWR